jgi:hypothetical protein
VTPLPVPLAPIWKKSTLALVIGWVPLSTTPLKPFFAGGGTMLELLVVDEQPAATNNATAAVIENRGRLMRAEVRPMRVSPFPPTTSLRVTWA